MILLDTNVLSALMLRTPSREVEVWINGLPRSSVWTTSITLHEIQLGIEVLAESRRRSELELNFEKLRSRILANRIAAFDGAAAEQAAILHGARRKLGLTIEERDAMIAGIALAQRATLATRNIRHFDDLSIPVVNPWEV